MFFNLSDMHILNLGILFTIAYTLYCHLGPTSEVYTWISRCFGYPPVLPSIGTATSSPGPALHSSKRRNWIHSLPLHLNSFHSKHIHCQYQPPPPYRPPPAGLRPGVSKSGQPSEAPVSAPTHTITSVKVPLPTRHSIGVPHFDPVDVKSLAEYFEDFELLATGAQLSDAEKIKYHYAHRYALR